MTKDLTSGSPLKVILMFTLPLVLGNLFQQFYALADTIIVGRDPEIACKRPPDLLRLLLAYSGIIDMVEVPATGCEKFAEMIYEVAEQWLKDAGFSPRCHLVSVEVSEHGGNSAIYQP